MILFVKYNRIDELIKNKVEFTFSKEEEFAGISLPYALELGLSELKDEQLEGELLVKISFDGRNIGGLLVANSPNSWTPYLHILGAHCVDQLRVFHSLQLVSQERFENLHQ